MKLHYSFIIGLSLLISVPVFAEFFENLGDAVGSLGNAAGDVVTAPGRLIHHHHAPYRLPDVDVVSDASEMRSGTIIISVDNASLVGKKVEFTTDGFAFIGDEKHKIKVIDCIAPGGFGRKDYFEGQKYFTYQETKTGGEFTCRYVPVQ